MASQVINFKANDTLLAERTFYPAEVKKKKRKEKSKFYGYVANPDWILFALIAYLVDGPCTT